MCDNSVKGQKLQSVNRDAITITCTHVVMCVSFFEVYSIFPISSRAHYMKCRTFLF